MLIQKPLLSHITISIVALLGLLAIIFFTEPCLSYSANNFCKSVSAQNTFLFYLFSLFLFYGVFTSILYIYRFNTKADTLESNIHISSREGLILSLLINASLGLLSFNLLNGFSLSLLCLIAFFAELLFITQVDN